MIVHRFAHQAMGTFFEILIAGTDEAYDGQAAQAGFREIDRLEGFFSRFDIRSEIARINRLRPGQAMAIGVETFECLTIAEQVRTGTNGAFDVNARAWQSKALGEEDEDEGVPAFELRETPTGFEFIRSDGPPGEVPALSLDLGAIGKGYALDSALEILLDWDVENALLHGGTSTALAVGSSPENAPSGGGWPVGVGAGWPGLCVPREINLIERALSGSGTEVKGPHILDPRTGKPAGGHIAAWAAHPQAAVSDALSTAFMVMSTDEVDAFCSLHPDVWALAVIDYGKCRAFNWV